MRLFLYLLIVMFVIPYSHAQTSFEIRSHSTLTLTSDGDTSVAERLLSDPPDGMTLVPKGSFYNDVDDHTVSEGGMGGMATYNEIIFCNDDCRDNTWYGTACDGDCSSCTNDAPSSIFNTMTTRDCYCYKGGSLWDQKFFGDYILTAIGSGNLLMSNYTHSEFGNTSVDEVVKDIKRHLRWLEARQKGVIWVVDYPFGSACGNLLEDTTLDESEYGWNTLNARYDYVYPKVVEWCERHEIPVINVRQWVIENYNTGDGTTTENIQTNFCDVYLGSDTIHLNNDGTLLIANYIRSQLEQLNLKPIDQRW